MSHLLSLSQLFIFILSVYVAGMCIAASYSELSVNPFHIEFSVASALAMLNFFPNFSYLFSNPLILSYETDSSR